MKRRKQRNYNGNPLAYYRTHPKEFEEYENRSQLARGDSGMHRALIRYGQLEEAIPEANNISVELGRKCGKGELDLSSEDKEMIIRAYKPSKGNASEAARNLHYASSTILKYWRKKEFKIREKGREAVLSETQINETYKPSKGNASEAARNLNCCVDSVLRHWKKEGLEIRKRGRQSLYQEQINEIIVSYEIYDRNAAEASRNLPYAATTIIRYWKNVEFEIHRRGRRA